MRQTPLFDGGTAEDQQRILALHQEWLDAQNTLDTRTARRLMTADPTAVFWNINGHQYTGIDHWCRLWDYYRTQFETVEPWRALDVKVIIRKIRGYPRGIPIRAATVDYGGGALPAGLSVGRVTLSAEASG